MVLYTRSGKRYLFNIIFEKQFLPAEIDAFPNKQTKNLQLFTNLKYSIGKYILRLSGAWHIYSELPETASLVTVLSVYKLNRNSTWTSKLGPAGLLFADPLET